MELTEIQQQYFDEYPSRQGELDRYKEIIQLIENNFIIKINDSIWIDNKPTNSNYKFNPYDRTTSSLLMSYQINDSNSIQILIIAAIKNKKTFDTFKMYLNN